MHNRECYLLEFSSERVIQIRESTIRVRVCESRAHLVFNQSSGGFICIIRVWLPHLPRWNFLLPVAKKNNNAAKFNVSLKQNNSRQQKKKEKRSINEGVN